jgi:ubiquinone/menaquinone biosynthesis C-methylase UbiE
MIPFWATTAQSEVAGTPNIAIPATGSVADSAASSHHQPNRRLNDRIIDHLRLQPYQHVLEVGCGTGDLLEETARHLRVGFLAAVEPDVDNYQQACLRNKRFMDSQLLQIHLGQLQDLPYPPHYFHTVYSPSDILKRKHPEVQLLRLTRLLRSGGRLVLQFHPGTVPEYNSTRQIQLHYIAAGIASPEIATIGTTFGAALLATAIMP